MLLVGRTGDSSPATKSLNSKNPLRSDRESRLRTVTAIFHFLTKIDHGLREPSENQSGLSSGRVLYPLRCENRKNRQSLRRNPQNLLSLLNPRSLLRLIGHPRGSGKPPQTTTRLLLSASSNCQRTPLLNMTRIADCGKTRSCKTATPAYKRRETFSICTSVIQASG